MPTQSAPMARSMRISAGVSYEGPGIARRISRGYHEHSTRRACASAPYGSITNGDIHPLTLSAAAASLGRGPSLVRAFKFLALLAATAAVFAAVTGAAPARPDANKVTFQDSRGEDPAGPDITSIDVSNDNTGLLREQSQQASDGGGFAGARATGEDRRPLPGRGLCGSPLFVVRTTWEEPVEPCDQCSRVAAER